MNFPFENDARFASLPFSDQQQLRLRYASKQLQQDQRFLNLPENDKLLLLQKVMNLPPVYKNPEVAPHFAELAKTPVLSQTFLNANKQSGILGVVSGMIGKVMPEAQITRELIFGDDAAKGAAWLQGLIDSSTSLSPVLKVLPTLGTIAGFAADLASYAAATHTVPTTLIGGTLSDIGARSTSMLSKWLLSDFAPHAAKMAGMGLTGVLRENLLKVENGQSPDTSIGDIAKTFGTYAAGDTLFWNALAWGFPFLKLTGRVLRSFGKSSRSITESLYTLDAAGKKVPLSAEQMKEYEAAMNRGDLPETLLQTASPAVQDHFTALKDRQFWAAHPELAQRDPMGKTSLAAGSIGLDVVKTETGFRVRHITDPGVAVDVSTLGQLDESLVQYLRERKSLFNLDELRGDPLRGHLVRMMDAQDSIADALKAAKPEGARPAFVSLSDRILMSPVEAEGLKASSFSGAGQQSVADTFHIPLSEATLSKVAKERSLLPTGADAMPLSKEGGTPNVFVLSSKVAPTEEFKAAQAWAARAQDAGSKESLPTLTATALRRAGYDGASLPDGTFLSLYPDRQVKILDNTVSPLSGRSDAFKAPVRMKMEDVSISLKGLKGTVPDAAIAGDNRLLGALLKTSNDVPNVENASRGASILLKRLGAKDSRASVQILEDATRITVRSTVNGVKVFVPPKMKNFGSEVAKALADHVAEEGRTLRQTKIEGSLRIPEDAQTVHNLKAWFANLIERDPLTKNWVAKNASGLDPLAAIRKMALSETTPALLKVELSELGVRVIGGEGNLKAMQGGKVIASAKTGSELLSSLGIDLKLSSKFAPKVVGLTPDAVTFEVQGIGVKGGPRDIWKLLDSFQDVSEESAKRKIFASGDGSVSFVSAGKYEVSIPAYGVKESFSSIEEARNFIKTEWKSWKGLKDRIEGAGGTLRGEKGKYVAYVGGSKYEAASLPELANVLKELPQPGVMPQLVGEDVSLYFKEGAPLLDFKAFRPKYVDQPPLTENPNFFSKISMMIKPMGAWVTDYARKLGNIEVLRQYNDLQQGVNLGMRDTDLMVELLDDIVRPGGKLMKGQQREGLFYLLGEANKENRAAIIEKFALGETELAAEQRLRAMLGISPNDPAGLFAKFGLDPWKFIYGYMSRIRAHTDEASILHLNAPEATEEILAKAFGRDSVPNEIKFWAENMRQSDVISFALDTDIYSVMRRYITRGNLRLYAGEPWRNMVALLNKPETDKVLRWRVFRYMDMLQGGGFTDGEKLMQHFSAAFVKALGGSKGAQAETLHHDVMRTIYSLSYATHLGWRPFVAIRNLMQMYQTVGPLVGNDYLQKAAAFVSSKAGREYIQTLRRLGVIHQAPPLVNQLADGEHILHKLTDRSLSMFKTADDLTRAIGYRAAQTRFDDGIRAFKTVNLDNARKFSEYVGANLFGPEMNSRILEASMAGKTDAARHIFANAVQERALFLMRREQSPVAFHGFIGKMFGQYGTFAANYVQFVSQTWKYATKAQKAAFAARWIGNSAALAAGMYAIGLRGKDWLPWAPAQFTGGPLFNLAVDMIHSVGSDYQARQARGELNRMLPIDINKLVRGEGFEVQPPVGMPTYYQIRTLSQMVKYASEGDAWKTFLSLLSAPIRSE